MSKDVRLIFELSEESRRGYSLPKCDVPSFDLAKTLPSELIRKKSAELPQVSETQAVRHFTNLSKQNYGVDAGFYPLGSCTMKYNPKLNEAMTRLEGFAHVHPYQPEETVQGCLEVMYELQEKLCEITGMDAYTLSPAAGAHGEMCGLMVIKKYHEKNGQGHRNKIIVPDSAHGTNPASAAVVGYDIVEVKSNERGTVDLNALKEVVDDNTAGLMLTNPNTLGLFEEDITKIADIVHDKGGLLYYDGANANAIVGVARPGDMGFDVLHLNLHKTFSTPHGGGGPGSGPVGVVEKLAPYLPNPVVVKTVDGFKFHYDSQHSIGMVRSFYGNFGVLVRALSYILTMGYDGLTEVATTAVLNANYVSEKLKEYYDIPFGSACMHEVVVSASRQKEQGASALDVAKRLIDFGFHPPTVYFPLIVKEALMIEPTETESKDTLDVFIDAMISIAKEAKVNADSLKDAPVTAPVSRLDEVRAARNMILKYPLE